MPEFTSPQVVVQRQLDAYNAKNMDAWLASYAPEAQQFELGGQLLASGHAEIRARTALGLKSRICMRAFSAEPCWVLS